MPLFQYKGANSEGNRVSGSLQADNKQKALNQLKKENIFIFELKNKTETKKKDLTFFAKRVDIKTLCTMTRLLATLIKSNVPLVDSLTTLSRQISHSALTPALTQIRNQVNEGRAFYKALSEYPKIFSPAYISMCEAGESSGTLDIILLKLAEFTEHQAELNNKIRSALAYPVLMMVFTFGIVLFLFTYLIPKFTELFEGENIIPWYTAIIISLSDFIIHSSPKLLAGLAIAVFLIGRWARSPKGKERLDAFYINLPVIGKSFAPLLSPVLAEL